MSQIYKPLTSSGPIPPVIPTTFTADDATTATPAANNLNVFSSDTNANNDNGIRTTASGSTVTIQLTNRITGTVTTSDATPTTIASVSLGAVPGTYYIFGDLIAYNVTDTVGAAYSFTGSARTDGASATEIGVELKDTFEDVAMAAADFSLGVTANTAYIQVTGIAGKTIHWNTLINYRYVG